MFAVAETSGQPILHLSGEEHYPSGEGGHLSAECVPKTSQYRAIH